MWRYLLLPEMTRKSASTTSALVSAGGAHAAAFSSRNAIDMFCFQSFVTASRLVELLPLLPLLLVLLLSLSAEARKSMKKLEAWSPTAYDASSPVYVDSSAAAAGHSSTDSKPTPGSAPTALRFT